MIREVAKPGEKIIWTAANFETVAIERNMNLYPHRNDLIRIRNKNFTEIHLMPHEYEIKEDKSNG